VGVSEWPAPPHEARHETGTAGWGLRRSPDEINDTVRAPSSSAAARSPGRRYEALSGQNDADPRRLIRSPVRKCDRRAHGPATSNGAAFLGQSNDNPCTWAAGELRVCLLGVTCSRRADRSDAGCRTWASCATSPNRWEGGPVGSSVRVWRRVFGRGSESEYRPDRRHGSLCIRLPCRVKSSCESGVLFP
jgi:hypothetical protein